MVVCSSNCSYKSKDGFCEKDVVSINKFGQCMKWFDKNGKPIMQDRSNTARSPIVVVEGEYKDAGAEDNQTSVENS